MLETDEKLEASSRKRKFEDDDSENSNEKRKQSKAEIELSPQLLDLADEVLLEILGKLDGESLHNLGLTCSYMKRLIQDKKLWSEATFTAVELDIWDILKRLKYMQVSTKTLKIRGNCKKENIDSRVLPTRQTFKEVIKRIVDRSPLIQNLYFTQMWFDWTKDFSISKFPANLQILSFKNCIMPKSNRNRRMVRTFTGIVEHMPQLQELRLEYCNFFESNDVMPFSKLQHLKVLSLRGCSKLKNCVPYLSLACRFGFPRLESLDLRETNVSDGEIQCLNAIKALKELYLEYPEMEPAADSDDDDDFHLFLRGPRRPTGQLPVRIYPEPIFRAGEVPLEPGQEAAPEVPPRIRGGGEIQVLEAVPDIPPRVGAIPEILIRVEEAPEIPPRVQVQANPNHFRMIGAAPNIPLRVEVAPDIPPRAGVAPDVLLRARVPPDIPPRAEVSPDLPPRSGAIGVVLEVPVRANVAPRDPQQPPQDPRQPQQFPPQQRRASRLRNNIRPSTSSAFLHDASSSESFSDSLSSSSSSDLEDSALRTIVIRANINPNANNGQPNEPRIQVILGDAPHASRYLTFGRNENRLPLSISDRGMLGFGIPRPNLMGNLVFIGNQPADPNTYLERIVLRNFRNITDTTLSHFETNAPRLVYLDVRGCPQITREAVERFKAARAACELISNFDNEE